MTAWLVASEKMRRLTDALGDHDAYSEFRLGAKSER